MAWSKASESTNSFLVGAEEYGDNNIGVIQDYIDFLVTRGWVVARTEFPAVDAPTDADRNWYWYFYKNVVCEDGGTSEWGYQIRYWEDVDSSDTLYLYGWNRGSEDLSNAAISQIDINGTYTQDIAGKWSFWQSDLDSDSLFAMAGDGARDQIFGFWMPTGTMCKQGGGDYNVKTGGLKLITTDGSVYGSGSSYRDANMSFPFGATSVTYMQDMNPQNMKLDLCIGVVTSNANRRLFASYGGDVHTHLNFSEGFEVLSTLAQFNTTNVLLIDGRYYIAWGYKSAILFDCGETAPVF